MNRNNGSSGVEYSGIVLTFEEDLSESEADELVKAAECFDGVVDVERIENKKATDIINRRRVASDICNKLENVFSDILNEIDVGDFRHESGTDKSVLYR